MITDYEESTFRQELGLSQSSMSSLTLGKIAVLLPFALMPSEQLLGADNADTGVHLAPGFAEVTDSTNSASNQFLSELDLAVLTAIGKLHEELVQEQIDLDGDAKDILYENLWELYI